MAFSKTTSDARVLVADDNESICNFLAEILQYRQCDVTCVFDADELKTFIDHTTWDLVLTDIMMPGPDVYEVLKDCTCPVIIMSGDTSHFKEGFHSLSKPFSINSIYVAVDKALGRIKY